MKKSGGKPIFLDHKFNIELKEDGLESDYFKCQFINICIDHSFLKGFLPPYFFKVQIINSNALLNGNFPF